MAKATVHRGARKMRSSVHASTDHLQPVYLAPYLDAVRQHGAEFQALLWASPQTQAARFEAICRLENPKDRSVADVGCGRADFLDFCLANDIAPAEYIGIEAVTVLAAAAQAKQLGNSTIIRADVVQRPSAMFVGADVIVISGALNTLAEHEFFSTIHRAFDAAAESLVFNFLSAPAIAAADFLRWYRVDDVLRFSHRLSSDVRVCSNYLLGDTTIAIRQTT